MLFTTSVLLSLRHGIISLPDSKSCDVTFSTFKRKVTDLYVIYWVWTGKTEIL